jgi:hypothetical protein
MQKFSYPWRFHKIRFNSFQPGARTNPKTGIDTTPISSPTIPVKKAKTVHFAGPAADGSA